MDYSAYQHLTFERRPNGVMLVTFNRPEVLNATNDRLHYEISQVWLTIGADPDTRVAVITGKGRAFSAGGDLAMVEANATDPRRLATTLKEASDIVYNMINLDKPVISAINGVADKLALGAQNAIRLTKRSLNNWLRMAGPIFDNSMALELLTFMEEDVREGARAIKEKRPPRFPSVTSCSRSRSTCRTRLSPICASGSRASAGP